MKNRNWMLIALFLSTGMLLIAQENRGNSWAALGYQMDLTSVGEDSGWNMGHGLKVLVRGGILPINDNIGFGVLGSFKFSFLKEMDWISPDTGNVTRIADAILYLTSGLCLDLACMV